MALFVGPVAAVGAGADDAGPAQTPAPTPPADGRSHFTGDDLARALGRVLALLGFVVGARTISDNSFLTHLATGHLIIDTATVPTVDIYSHWAAGESWTVQSWLASLIYALLDDTVGGWGIRVLHGGLGAAITLGLWTLTAPARQLVVRVGLVSSAVLTGTVLWPPRPLLFGLAAMVLALQVVQGLRPRWWLVPVFWFWVNTHGSFVLGLVMVGAVGLGAAIDRRRWPGPEAALLAGAVGGCLLGMANPLGWRLLWFPFHLLARGGALSRVAEWASPDFRSVPEQLFLVLLALLVVAATRGARWRQLVPALVFFVAGLMALRNLGLASVVMVAFLAPSLSGMVGELDGTGPSRLARPLGATALVGLFMSCVVVAITPPVDLSGYPAAEVDWLEERSLVASRDVAVAQRDIVGNYLTLRYGPGAEVFMDDRFDFHPPDVIDDHTALILGGDMGAVLERRRFDVILWATRSPLRRWIDRDGDWEVVQEDETWFIACRRSSDVYERCR